MGTSDVVADLNVLGTSDVVSDMNTLGTSDNVTNMNTLADNISSVNSFAEKYRIASSAPSSSLHEGDLWWNSNAHELRAYNTGSSQWAATAPTAANQAAIDIVAGDIVYSEDLGSIATSVTTGSGNSITTVGNAIANVNTTAGAIANVNLVGGSIANVNLTGGSISNVNAVAGNATNINAVAADASDIGAVAGKATEIGRLGTAAAVADLAILGTSAIVADLAILATSDVVNDMNVLGTSSNVTAMNTVAGSIADVNRYATQYTIASSAPSSPASGDLWYDSNANTLKFYTGSTWASISAGIASVAGDTSPQLGGALDGQNNNMTNIGTISGANLQLDFGGL